MRSKLDRCAPARFAAGVLPMMAARFPTASTLLEGVTMRFAEFRDRLEGALQEAGLSFHDADRRVETIDLVDTVRSWKIYIRRAAPQSAEPFYVSAEIGFEWSPVDAARAYTCEEDLLAELVGRRKRPIRTEHRWTRIDLSLRAGLPYGSTTSMPEPHVFGAWTASVLETADAAFTDVEQKKGRIVAVLGGHGDVEVQAHCKPDGIVSLKALAISGFQTVRVPRAWDDPERRVAERDPRDDLGRLARRFKTALDEWTKSVSELATWIRYSPPPPGAKPVEPWFDDQSEDDDDGGPDTTH